MTRVRNVRAAALAMCILLAAPPSVESAAVQEAALRIVVLEGEDSVNIIDSGMTVPTLVEVRDREDRPVSGASVQFQVEEDGLATLNGGVQQVVVATDALGQAAVTVEPIASGAVQLSVTATFQGQTATAVIVNTNFATVAEAEAAGVGAPTDADAGRDPGVDDGGDIDVDGDTAGVAGGVAVADGGLGTGAMVGILGGVGAAVGVGVAVSGGGGSSPSAPVNTRPSVPTAPSAPTLTPGDGQLDVSWNAAASNGAAITDYDVQYRRSGGAWREHVGQFLDRRATITGLTNRTAYEVQVRAANSVGEGPWSAGATGWPAAVEYELTVLDVRFNRVENDRYWVRATARNSGSRSLEVAHCFVSFYDRNGNGVGGVSQGIFPRGVWPPGEERTDEGFQYILTGKRSSVAYYRLRVGPDTVRCIGCDREYRDFPSANVTGLAGLSVADADAAENVDDTIDFTVTLDRAASGTVSVDYATSDGSARAGADYTAQSGTLTFSPGERSKTVQVVILDDTHDEGEETFTLALSNASGVVIVAGQASGRISNHDPLPRALVARFGRTAAVHVVEQVEERLGAPREPGFEGRFAGLELRPGMERDLALSFLGRAAGPVGGASGLGALAGVMEPAVGQMASGGTGNGLIGGRSLLDRGVGGDMLAASAFALSRETRRGGVLSFWSRGAQSSFRGREGVLALGGDVRTTMFGADYAKGPLVVGVSLANSQGLGNYAGVDDGRVASSMTGLYPWLGLQGDGPRHGLGRGRLRGGGGDADARGRLGPGERPVDEDGGGGHAGRAGRGRRGRLRAGVQGGRLVGRHGRRGRGRPAGADGGDRRGCEPVAHGAGELARLHAAGPAVADAECGGRPAA